MSLQRIIPLQTLFLRGRRPGFRPVSWLLVGLMLLSASLHFTNLKAIGAANTYYTAAVKSMLQSWSNFFFVAAEPGGSVTVDKPPLGLWVEAAFAFVLGVQGWVVALPNMLAGILSVPLLYRLVRQHLGEWAGLIAASVLVVTPVAVATNRNNTMDGLLVFTLLLAAWAFVAATASGSWRRLVLGAFLLGLGFNIKMLQAFLPLPAFYTLYCLGAAGSWKKKLLGSGFSVVILLISSLAWAICVDLTPPDRRPYIGSSGNNTVMGLIVGHNGLSRLFNPRAGNAPAPAPGGPGGQLPLSPSDAMPGGPAVLLPPPPALEVCQGRTPGETCSFTQPNGTRVSGVCLVPPTGGRLACVPAGSGPQDGPGPGGQSGQPRPGFNPPPGALGDGPAVSPHPGPGQAPFSQETGSPGVARFFVAPLSKQLSWLLPMALVGAMLVALAARPRLPLAAEHQALVLWGGWLLTCLIFFSAVEGIFHAYYTIMLAPPLGALIGAGVALFWRWQASRPWVNAGLAMAAVGTVAFQLFTARQYGYQSSGLYLAPALLAGGLTLLVSRSLRPAGYGVVVLALLVIPFLWTGLTVLDERPDVNLPTAFNGQRGRQTAPAPDLADQALVTFLQAQTSDVTYLVAVPNARLGAPFVLATGRPVLYMGGFSGSDPVIDADGLSQRVANGQLRYVLFGGDAGWPELAAWLRTACAVVPEFGQGKPSLRPGGEQPVVLYRCLP